MKLSPPPAKAARPTSVAPARKSVGRARAKKGTMGVVRFCARRSSDKGGGKGFTPSELITRLEAGLVVDELDELQRRLDLPMEKLLGMLGIAKATLHRRRKENKRLSRAESDRVVRYARLLGKALEVMESEENARKWLRAPQVGLGGAVPLAYAVTEVGAREVEDLLGRIEYGVYS